MSKVVPIRGRAPTSEPFVTRAQAAEHFHVHVHTIDNWIRQGCPSHTWGQRMRRLRVSEVEGWLNQ